jgi:hypothetical protein
MLSTIQNSNHPHSAATNSQTNEGVAIKKVTNVFSKKILAKRALREIKLLQHFRGKFVISRSLNFIQHANNSPAGHRNVSEPQSALHTSRKQKRGQRS